MIKLDNSIAHDSRVQHGNVVGNFCNVPIVTLDELGMDDDVSADISRTLLHSSGTSVPPEVLPGEDICSDNIIRRTTTAEAVGYDTYHNQEAIEVGTKRVSLAEARQLSQDGLLVHYRPNRHVGEGEYALVTEE